ncbi:MAG: DUF3137 domain-containing protein [Myxococcota bacterium]|nr:DUF3137 domain-containing protein [Myxococcota bacterium]
MDSNSLVPQIVEKLWPRLLRLEKQRKKIVVSIYRNILIGAFITLLAFWFSPVTSLIVFPFIALIGYLSFKSRYVDYVSRFKHGVIREIITLINPFLRYTPKGCIAQYHYINSKLFDPDISKYRGEDLIEGTIKPTKDGESKGDQGSTNVKFSEIFAQKEMGNRKNKKSVTVFRGLFFVADFNKRLTGTTILKPDLAEKLLGHFGTILQDSNLMQNGELVKLENPEFEEHFVVYSTDQQEARYILSSQIMERILWFKQKTDQRVYMSFNKKHVYVGISGGNDRFEPSLFQTLLRNELFEQYITDIELMLGLVEDLNLNRRIWH